jgi:LCP family protein required for cell wall assembly
MTASDDPDAPAPEPTPEVPSEPVADHVADVPAATDEPVDAETADPASVAARHGLTPDDQQHTASRFQPKRTWAQRALLVLNILVITGCFIGAGTLLVARQVAHGVGKVDIDTPAAAPTVLTAPATVSTDGTTPPTVIQSTVPVSTLPGDTAPPPTASTAPPETFPPADPTAKNFLITGADNNACIDPDSPYAGAFGDRENMGERSDTVMVMRVDPANKRAAVLSFPRDLWVQIANSGRKSRINSAYVKDDPRNLIATIVLNFQVGIDHFIQVDFCAFKRLVEAVDGVSVPFTFPARDENTGLNVPEPGCFRFDGDHALAYVRSRHYEYLDEEGEWKEDPASDLGRISRQQDFIRRTLDAALAKGVYNPSVARGVIDIATQSIVVDEGLTASKMLEFFGVLRDFDPGSISTYQIEATPQNISGNAVLVPRLDGENMQSILHIFQGIAPLASAPEQVFETTTTTTGPGDTDDTTDPTSDSTTTVVTSTTTIPGVTSSTVFVEGPDENVKGIVPPDTPC